MKLQGLHIDRNESYHSTAPLQLAGEVLFIGPNSTQTYTLSPMAILRLIQCIEKETCTTAQVVANEIPKAFTDVSGEQALLVHSLVVSEDA